MRRIYHSDTVDRGVRDLMPETGLLSEERLKTMDRLSDWQLKATEIAMIGSWRFALDDQAWELNTTAVSVYGLDPLGNQSRANWLESLSAIEQLRVMTAWEVFLSGQGEFDIEYEHAGRTFWERATLEFDAQGEAVAVIGVVQDMTRHHLCDEETRRRANFDLLTGLPNRSMFDNHLQKSLALCKRSGLRVALLMIDLDRFKAVNDTHGHEIGDRVLCAAAQRMSSCLRASDMLARQGGDEFVALLHDIDFDATAGLIALRLIEEVARPYVFGEIEARIGASVGIAMLPDAGVDAGTLFSTADAAMYSAKSQGRETLCFSSPEQKPLHAGIADVLEKGAAS